MIIGIVAVAQNFAIGRDGKLPWHWEVSRKDAKGQGRKKPFVLRLGDLATLREILVL